MNLFSTGAVLVTRKATVEPTTAPISMTTAMNRMASLFMRILGLLFAFAWDPLYMIAASFLSYRNLFR